MLFIHPLLQFTALVLALYTLFLGYKRFAATQLGKKGPFAWKRHVLLGTLGMAIWLPGLGLGLLMAYWQWNIVFITGPHYQVALTMVPFILFGYFSGLVMDRKKAKRKVLPLLHGANNLLLALLALVELGTGLGVIREFILP